MLSPWTRTYSPEREDIDDVAGIFTRFFNDVDSQFVLQAANASDRNTRYRLLPKGRVVVTQNDGALWVKMSDTEALWSNGINDTGVVRDRADFVLHSDWEFRYDPVWRLYGAVAEIHIGLTRIGPDYPAALTGSNAGDIPARDVVHVPTPIRPPQDFPITMRGSMGVWGGVIKQNSEITINSGPPGAVFSTGDFLVIHSVYLV